MKIMGRYVLSLSPHQPQEIEGPQTEDSDKFVNLVEEPSAYKGITPERFRVLFVDGVRRTECLAYVKDEETLESFEGAFLSLGAGVLRVEYGRLNHLKESLLLSKVERLFFYRKGLLLEEILGFRPYPVEGDISTEVNRYMREEMEARLALQAYGKVEADLIVCDGPLSNKLKNTPLLGLIKGIKRLYLGDSYLPLLYSLQVGQRSPIIKVCDEEGKEEKYTWYVKLTDHEGLYGLVRVEVFATDLQEVKRLADLSAGILPLFASKSFQDRRSPQNLLPIGRLEKFLRLHLGPYKIIRRQIESFFYA